jgi:hypothetical protein
VRKSGLEQNQSEYTLLESLRDDFFWRRKPLEDIASGRSNSAFALAQTIAHWSSIPFTARPCQMKPEIERRQKLHLQSLPQLSRDPAQMGKEHKSFKTRFGPA